MSLGIHGSHRTGKSTLATEYSLETGAPLLLVNSGDVFSRLSLDPSKHLSADERLSVQEAILDNAEDLYAGEKDYFIADRTPLDMLAYALLDLSAADNISELQQKRFERYQKRCIDVTNRYFSLLFLIQPGIPMRDAPGKGKFCAVNQSCLNEIMKGLLINGDLAPASRILNSEVLGVKDRLDSLLTAEGETFLEQINGINQQAIGLH